MDKETTRLERFRFTLGRFWLRRRIAWAKLTRKDNGLRTVCPECFEPDAPFYRRGAKICDVCVQARNARLVTTLQHYRLGNRDLAFAEQLRRERADNQPPQAPQGHTGVYGGRQYPNFIDPLAQVELDLQNDEVDVP